jgi:hypothetical protein
VLAGALFGSDFAGELPPADAVEDVGGNAAETPETDIISSSLSKNR